MTAFQQAWESGRAATVIGTVTVLYDDNFANHTASVIQIVRDERTGESFELNFEKSTPTLQTGTRLQLVGRTYGSGVYGSRLLVAGCCEPTTSTVTSSTMRVDQTNPTASTSTDDRTLVMIGNFSDSTVSCSASSINDIMFADPAGQSVAAVYLDNSQGQRVLSGDVVGPYTIAASSNGPCDLGGWATAVEAAATAAGANLATYAHHVLVLAPNACFGTGKGTIGGTPSTAWIFICSDRSMYEHELGHNFGMDHAATDDGTTISEYGDNTDPLGVSTGSVLKGFNAPHRYQMGWLDPNATQVITQAGFYNVAPLALNPALASAPQDLLIAKPDTSEYYHLSYRIPGGFENGLDINAYRAVSVHRFKADSLTDLHTYRLALLQDGQSFRDAVNGITVTMVAHNDNYATLQIGFATASCVSNAPVVSASPSSQNGRAGSTINYAVALMNQDSVSCPPTSFQIGSSVPSGWAASSSSSTLTLGAGQSGQVTLSVTSAQSAVAASYGINARVTDSQQPTHSGSASLTYVVQSTADTTPPSAPVALTGALSRNGKQIQLTWGAAADNVGVVGYRIWRDGAMIGTSTTTNWADQAISARATYSYWVVAYDAAGNVSPASNSVTVVVGGGSGRR
jgi:hypothetical protein